jgi:hypothetical protein
MICIICKHNCHCNDVCQADNGCGCNICEHAKEENILEKICNKIKSWLM